MFLLFAEKQTLINFGFFNRIDPKPTLGKKIASVASGPSRSTGTYARERFLTDQIRLFLADMQKFRTAELLQRMPLIDNSRFIPNRRLFFLFFQ